MKALLFSALFVMSFGVFAEATQNVLGILPQGTYNGVVPDTDDSCSVSVRAQGDRVLVTATAGSLKQSTDVIKNSVYRWNPGNRYFLSSRYLSDSVETILHMIADTETTQYVVVSKVTTRGTNITEDKVECIVDL